MPIVAKWDVQQAHICMTIGYPQTFGHIMYFTKWKTCRDCINKIIFFQVRKMLQWWTNLNKNMLTEYRLSLHYCPSRSLLTASEASKWVIQFGSHFVCPNGKGIGLFRHRYTRFHKNMSLQKCKHWQELLHKAHMVLTRSWVIPKTTITLYW